MHFPVWSLMNRLNQTMEVTGYLILYYLHDQTESAVFQICRVIVYPNDPISDYLVQEPELLTLKGLCFNINPSVLLIAKAVIIHVIELLGGSTWKVMCPSELQST